MELDFNNMIPELHYYIHRKCTPTWKIEPATIHFIDITYVIAGKADYAIGEERLSVRKGDLICIPKNTYRAAVCVPDDLMECYSINFFLRDRAGIDVAFPIPVKTHIGIEPELISSFHKIYEIWLQKNFGYMLQITSIQCEILHKLLSFLYDADRIARGDPRIDRSIAYLSANYAEPITVDAMAELFHLSPVYYGSLFHKATGMTFRQYLSCFRLNCAENMLKCGEYSVTEVAEKCGFADVCYFSREFKKKKGVNPSLLLPQDKASL